MTEAERWAEAATQAADDASLLLEAGRERGAALLHAEAAERLLRALLAGSGAPPAGTAPVDPAALPQDDALAKRFRAVWLDRPSALAPVPNAATLQAMADGLRGLIQAVRARIAPEPERGSEAATPRPVATPPKAAAPRAEPARTPKRRLREATPPPIAVPPRAAASPAEPKRPPPPRPATPPAPRKPVSSAAFWSLIDRWGVGDTDALDLLGRAGGLTRKGTRPRFRLGDAEIERFHLLQTLDDALAALGTDPRAWLGAPVKGATPLDTMRRGGDAAIRDATRQVVGEGLRRSLG